MYLTIGFYVITIKTMKRTDESRKIITKFIREEGAGFVYVRGRRRIGKSTLLQEITKEESNVFYFTGVLDERETKTLARFVASWSSFRQSTKLLEIKASALSWERVFRDIAENSKTTNVSLIFDEIQWLAKGQSGFVGLLKNAWVEWEKLKTIKVIICGSSNKFFHVQTGGEEQILRGLRTHSDIWLHPIGLSMIRQEKTLAWSNEEMIFASFFLGGVPYYWNQIKNENIFLRDLNRAVFTRESIFLDEVNELLRIEFNKAGTETVKKIIRAIGLTGATEATIVKTTRLGQSTVNETLKKLIDYSILFEKMSDSNKKEIKRSTFYYLKDPLLLCYVSLLYRKRVEISQAQDVDFILSRYVEGKSSYYIPEFTRVAFENIIQMMLEVPSFESNLKKLLKLGRSSYQVDRLHSEKVQFDLILSEVEDRQIRLIECKWTYNESLLRTQINTMLDRVQTFSQCFKINQKIITFIITNCRLTESLQKLSKQKNVQLIHVDQLF